MHRFSSCCWKPYLLPTSLCAQPLQRLSALGHCETLALSLPVLVLSQHPHYDSFHSLGREMLLPCLMLGDPQGRDDRGLEVSPRPRLISGHTSTLLGHGPQQQLACSLAGLDSYLACPGRLEIGSTASGLSLQEVDGTEM